jgi:carotenoid 1,2-hydratase
MPETAAPPPFDHPVSPGGYQWWYLDALDPEGQRGIVVIAFVGSVFSPYYFRSRRRNQANPEDFCAVNVGLYRRLGKAWCMTERRSASVVRDNRNFRIGPSALRWDGSELVIGLRERCAPFGKALRGEVRARPLIFSSLDVALDRSGRHRWTPWAPLAHVEVDLTEPEVSWHGRGYMDANRGEEPLDRGFDGWSWSRIEDAGVVDIEYELWARDGGRRALALRFDANGCAMRTPGARFGLPVTAWRLSREARGHAPPKLVRTLEDTPFYARSLLSVEGAGGCALGVHEALSLQRFRRAWVRSLLPFRMPRELRASGPRSPVVTTAVD